MPSNQWPFSISKTNEDLIKAIDSFDLDKYQQNVIKHHIESGSFEKGNACLITMKLIEEHTNQ